MATEYDYDLIVIGSGPAGEKGAAQAAFFGHKVALIEQENVPGGAAANTGTLPSKTLRESALFLSGFRHRELRGFHVEVSSRPTIKNFMDREQIVKAVEHDRIVGNMELHRVPIIFQGHARFFDEHTISVTRGDGMESRLTAKYILIATGSKPHRPPAFPSDNPRICDSDTILELDEHLLELPKSLVVVGGGVIGCEYACIFGALGVEITVIEKFDRLIGGMDSEISQTLRDFMLSKGMQVIFNDEVDKVSVGRNNIVHVALRSGRVVHGEAVVVSSGRSGNTDKLGLEAIGVQVNKRMQVQVNSNYQVLRDGKPDSAIPHIYAAGDVIGNPALASTAMEQARVAMSHAFNLGYKTGISSILPYGIYTIPECSSAGKTEEDLKKAGTPYVVGRAFYEKNARGQILGDHRGFLKLIFSDDDEMKLLGVHMIGEQATELVHVGLTDLMMNAGRDLFINTCYNYPTLTETYKYATYQAMGARAKAQAAKMAKS